MSTTETAFRSADAAWQAELVKVFGAKSAPNMRYVTAGKGMPGSTLRRVWEARETVRSAFVAAEA